MTDSDSSLFSLAQIQHLMRVEFGRAQRYGYPIACLMIAVDRLGHLRDMYGFETKEEILESVVNLLRGETRSSDFLGRTADDRLLAVVPHTGEAGLRVMCDRIMKGARGLSFTGDGRTIQITLSMGGTVQAGADGGTPFFDAMLETAEDALAEASEDGGGRLVLVPPGAALGG